MSTPIPAPGDDERAAISYATKECDAGRVTFQQDKEDFLAGCQHIRSTVVRSQEARIKVLEERIGNLYWGLDQVASSIENNWCYSEAFKGPEVLARQIMAKEDEMEKKENEE